MELLSEQGVAPSAPGLSGGIDAGMSDVLRDAATVRLAAAFPRLLLRPEASRYLAEVWKVVRASSTLRRLAGSGGGPRFRLDGRRAIYDRADLDSWAMAQIGELRETTRDPVDEDRP